jgi:hypothetical protein
MASLAVLVIILGCAAYQYLRSTIIKSFITLLAVVCASIVSFGYFEVLSGFFIAGETLTNWAQPISFIILFIISFAVLFTLATTLMRQPISFPTLHERIGRAVLGVLLGLLSAGLLLTVLAMAPISANYPYQRFETAKPDVDNPKKPLLNPDGLLTGWMSLVSRGSLAGSTSFSLLHARILDQLFLNRCALGDQVSIIADPAAIEIPKKACWPAREGLTDSHGNPIPQKAGHKLTVVRLGFTAKAVKSGKFTLAQIAVICKHNIERGRLTGSGVPVYPIGYLKSTSRIQLKSLTSRIEIGQTDIKGQARPIDFLFWVPEGFQPVAVRFKQNATAQIPPLVAAEQAPEPAPFIQTSDCTALSAQVQPVSSARIYGVQLGLGADFLAGLSIPVAGQNGWEAAQTRQSKKPALFDAGKITCAQAALRIEPKAEPNQPTTPAPETGESTESANQQTDTQVTQRKAAELFKSPQGYQLLSLKCNNPATGAAIGADQLPVLVEVSGTIHHPIGVIASAKLDAATLYEVDFCTLTSDQTPGGLTLAQDGSVAKPFAGTIWLTEQVQSISEFYVLYMIKAGSGLAIAAVRPAGTQTDASFEKYEGVFVN